MPVVTDILDDERDGLNNAEADIEIEEFTTMKIYITI